MEGQSAAILKRPPGPADSTTAFNRPFAQSVSGTGSAVAPVTTLTATDAAAIPSPGGCFITWVSDTDCYIRVGPSTMNIATTSDMFLPANTPVDWWHNAADTHFSVIQKSAGGTLKRHRSNA